MLSTVTQAGWVGFCQSQPGKALVHSSKQYFKANGESYWLYFSSQPIEHCQNLELNLSPDEIDWYGLISRDKSGQIEQRIVLQGLVDNGNKTITEVIEDNPIPNKEMSDTLGLYQNFISSFSIRTFGVEERVSFSNHDNVFEVVCAAGDKPAGVVFDVPQKKLPTFSAIEMMLAYKADGMFQLGIADDDRLSIGDPLINNLPVSETHITFPISHYMLGEKQSIHWSLVCPTEKASITLSTFELRFSNMDMKTPGRALWVWKPESWAQKPAELIQLLKKYSATRAMISIQIDTKSGDVLQVDKLEAFIKAAGAEGIKVWAVEGDPHATMPRGLKQFVARAKILEEYNRLKDRHLRLAGIQYDIEPYLVDGWELEQEQWYSAYISTIKRVNLIYSSPIEIAVPFWWQYKSLGNQLLLDSIAPYIDRVTVMNYRTDPQLIQRYAQPLLEWGVRTGKKIGIALEAGVVPDENQWHFALNAQGELWLITGLDQPLLILLNTAKTNPNGKAFKLYQQKMFSGNQISFHQNPAALLEMLPKLENSWSRWKSFQGVSLHGFESELYMQSVDLPDSGNQSINPVN